MTRKLLSTLPVLLFLMCAGTAHAAIAHDADSDSGVPSNPSGSSYTFTWSHTVTGSNPLLCVTILYQPGVATNGNMTVSSVTYNGVSLTQANTVTEAVNGGVVWQGYLVGPATGSNTISVTFATTGSFFNEEAAHGVASSFTGVDQSTPVDDIGGTARSTVSVSLNVTTMNANAWIIDAAVNTSFNPPLMVPGVGQTQSGTYNYAGQPRGFATSYQGPIASPGSTADSWTNVNSTGGANGFAMEAFSIKPAGGAPPATVVPRRR